MAQPEALAYFEQAKRDEPTNKQCFECDQPHPMWCDLWHAVYLCLGCSGKHRGLGTHISFVRSLNMDKWSDEHLNRMKAGGNGKAKKFFQSKGVADLPFHEKWNSDPAFMYKDMMEAVSQGTTFNPSSWVPPPRTQRTARAISPNARPDPAAAGAGKYQGMGSQSAKAAQGPDVIDALSSGWSMLSSTVSTAAAQAAQKSKELAAQAQEKNWGETTAKAQQSAAAGWASLAGASMTGWGALTSWANKVTAGEEDDALSSMLTKMDINKGTAYAGMSNAQQSPPQSHGGGPPPATQESKGGNDGWDDWKDDDGDLGNNKNNNNLQSPGKSPPMVSPVRTTTAGTGASLNAMRRKPAAGGRKAE